MSNGPNHFIVPSLTRPQFMSLLLVFALRGDRVSLLCAVDELLFLSPGSLCWRIWFSMDLHADLSL